MEQVLAEQIEPGVDALEAGAALLDEQGERRLEPLGLGVDRLLLPARFLPGWYTPVKSASDLGGSSLGPPRRWLGAWWLRAARYSKSEAQPLGAPPPPLKSRISLALTI